MSTKEKNFEDVIEAALLERGYAKGDPATFDRALAIFPAEVFAFVQATQADLWARLRKQHGGALEAAMLDALVKHLGSHGTLHVLRHGFKVYGTSINAAYFRPSHGLNPEVEAKYASNRLVVTRQLKFDPKSEQSLDLAISLNGIPVATLELKNSLTGQTVEHAKRQYREDRDPGLPIFRFKERALVHFAVDTDQVFMATRLAGKSTYFLPFNRGNEGGAGNPVIPGEDYRTEYLWKQALERHSFLDVLARFVHLLRVEDEVQGKKVVKETLVFPRYHQLDVVRQLVGAARVEGPGNSYLIQHSAGSGKSNSIAWTAHQLASLHDADDRKVFQSVVVITDRRVLDKQLQDTIYQFEHKQGVVARIDKDSNQLKDELEKGTPIVITTLQKFPFVAKKIEELPNRRYAIIVDEAHSSQTGESAKELKALLGSKAVADGVADTGPAYVKRAADDAEDTEEPTYEDGIAKTMAARGKQPNLSFFAFTATPKAKTLEVFGRPGADGKPLPFHLYSMRQAIEEGFILDVLSNYTTYKTYFELTKTIAEDPEVKKKEAAAAMARFVSLHPHNIAQKTEVIIEHFRTHVRKKLQGKAKAMVVTRSRLHAVRYKLAFDAYLREQKYADLRALVAFSGTVQDGDVDYTEVGMNSGLAETELPTAFASDAYQVLLVANKYQTGFDQPLLCAMYVDRKLSGVQAVQTLSRLNRTAAGKDQTFVLDFANDAEEIVAAFQPYYEATTVAEKADPHQLEALRHELDAAQIYYDSEVEAFAKVFYKPKQQLNDAEHAEIHRHLKPAEDRFMHWEDADAREAWRGKLMAFVKLYSFMSQVMPWTDRDLEVRYTFCRFLEKRLPRIGEDRFRLDGEVDLARYRLARIGETELELEKGRTGELKGPTDVGTRKVDEELVHLSDIVQQLNLRFGTDFTESDKLLFEQVVADQMAQAGVRDKANANSYENFRIAATGGIEGAMIDRMDRNGAIVSKFLNDGEFQAAVMEWIAKQVYAKARGEAA